MIENSGDVPIVRNGDFLHEEHVQVRAIARQIEASQDVEVLLPLLREHRAMLSHHFTAEEADDGLYSMILETAPEKAHHLDRLRQQHELLLAEINELCDAGPYLTSGEILSRTRMIARQLDEHEAEESGLLLRVFNTDLGTGD